MQPWTEALLKRLTSGSVHAGLCSIILWLPQFFWVRFGGRNDVVIAK